MHLQRYPQHSRLTYHFVWCAMRFKPCLCGDAGQRLAELLAEKSEALGLRVHDIRVLPDKVYMAVSAPPTVAPHHIACQLKAHSSRVMRTEFSDIRRLPSLWTRAYVVVGGDHFEADHVLAEFEALCPPRRPRGRPKKTQSLGTTGETREKL
jgi:putative transposase